MQNHAFVSSSTREGSTYHDALRNFGGEMHQKLIDAAKSAGVEVHPGVGYWEDGAEEMAHLKGKDAAEVGERLGRDFNQKSVLLFSETPHGPDRLWHFHTPEINHIREHLSPHISATKNGVYVLDMESDPEFAKKAKELAKKYKYGMDYKVGKHVFRETK